MPKIGLGTVQLGLPYGVNESLISEECAHNILKCALDKNILFFDTAIGYGESEKRIGSFLKNRQVNNLVVSTKIPRVEKILWDNEEAYFQYVKNSALKSLDTFHKKNHQLLQFHQCELNFLSAKSVRNVFERLIQEKICENIGISVYHPEQAYSALDIDSVTSLQIPVNLLDNRFITPDFIKKYKERNIFIIVRSIFLQGLLIKHVSLPNVKKRAILENLKEECMQIANKCDLQKLALDYIYSNQELNFISIALIGVNQPEELVFNLNLIHDDKIIEQNRNTIHDITELREKRRYQDLIDPSSWNV